MSSNNNGIYEIHPLDINNISDLDPVLKEIEKRLSQLESQGGS